MAFMSQEKKAKLAPAIKAILKKYGVKGTIAVRHHSTLVLNISSGEIDFIKERAPQTPHQRMMAGLKDGESEPVPTYIDINPYHYANDFTGDALKFLKELMPAMNVGNHDNSDIQTDYFDVGWYVDVNIGQWNKPYEFIGKPKTEA